MSCGGIFSQGDFQKTKKEASNILQGSKYDWDNHKMLDWGKETLNVGFWEKSKNILFKMPKSLKVIDAGKALIKFS
jgi:hypothetical protein